MTSNRELIAEAISSAVREVIAASTRVEFLKWLQKRIVPILPENTVLKPYLYSTLSITVEIPKIEGRPWAGMQGTAGLVYQVRKALGIPTLRRDTYGYVYGSDAPQEFSTRFFGSTTIDGRDLQVTVEIPGDKPTHCEIVWEETVDTTPRIVKRARSVCAS